MPPFPHLHNTAIYERRNNWSLKGSEGKKTLKHSLPSAAQYASGDLSALQSPTQGMIQCLSFYYIARVSWPATKTTVRPLWKDFSPLSRYTWSWTMCTDPWVFSKPHKMWKRANVRIYSYRLALLDFQITITKHKSNKTCQLFEQNRSKNERTESDRTG